MCVFLGAVCLNALVRVCMCVLGSVCLRACVYLNKLRLSQSHGGYEADLVIKGRL